MKSMLLILLLFSLVESREDPFKPFHYKEKNNKNEKLNTIVEFPDNTKKINRVIFEYETTDGAKTFINKKIDCKIDPKRVIVIKQSSSKKAGVEVDLSEDILADLNIEEEDSEVEIVKKTDFYTEIKRKDRREDPFKNEGDDKQTDKIKDKNFIKTVKIYDFISIDLYNKKFVIICYNKIKKQFMINGANKIVIDFKHTIKAKSRRINIFKPPFKFIEVGIHLSYYRVVIKLDNLKKFKLKHTDLGYEVKFE